MNKIYSVYEIADLNKHSLTSKDTLDFINYLDTSNLTRNKIDVIQFLEVDFPSRAKRKVQNNTILYSTVRPNQEHFGILENIEIENLIVSTGFTTIDVTSKSINSKYLYYKLTQPLVTKYLQSIAENSVSAYPSIKPETLGNLNFRFPDLPTQQKIAAVLSALDDKIELNNKINAELEAMAKTLYDYWFVQFEFPNSEGKPYKSSGGAMEYNSILKREIPKGWEVKKLGKVLKTHLGGTPSTKNEKFWNGNIPWMNSGEVANFPLISTEQNITEEAVRNSSTRFLKKGSVLLSITRHLRVNILGIDACINQSIAGIEENELFKNSYIYFSVTNDIDRLMKLRTGAQQPHINKEIVDDSPFLIPNLNVLNEYYNVAEPIIDRIILSAKQNQELAQLRDWLLPMLMNGQVKVSDVEDGVLSLERVAEPSTDNIQSSPLNEASFSTKVSIDYSGV